MNRTFTKYSTVLALLVFVVVAVTGCGSKGSSETPEQAIQAALEKTSQIKSGQAELDGSVSLGNLPGSIGISGGGPFDTEAKGGPAFSIELALDIAGSPQKFGFTSVDGKSYMLVGDKAVERKGKDEKNLTSGGIADMIKSLGDHISSAKETGDGTYTAKLDTKALFEAAKSGDGQGLAGLEIPGFGSAEGLAEELGVADVTIEVDSEGYADEIALNMPLSAGGGEGALRLTISIDEINEAQKISEPTNVVSEVPGLGGALGGE